jgi:hypothetical protein
MFLLPLENIALLLWQSSIDNNRQMFTRFRGRGARMLSKQKSIKVRD